MLSKQGYCFCLCFHHSPFPRNTHVSQALTKNQVGDRTTNPLVPLLPRLA